MKFYNFYYVLLIFQNFVVWGYFFSNNNILSKDKNKLCSFLLIFVIFISNYGNLKNLIKDMDERKKDQTIEAISQYARVIKMLEQKGKETIILPKTSEFHILRHFFKYVTIVHYPDFENVKMIVVDNNDDNFDFSLWDRRSLLDEKNYIDRYIENKRLLKDIKFSKLLQHKIEKCNNYDYEFRQLKEENNKVYYEKVFY